MKTIYQKSRLLLLLTVCCTTAMAQNTGRPTKNNSPDKKSTMQIVFIDRFMVPNQAKAKFLERMRINREFIKTLPGFVEDAAYEEAGETESRFVTVAVWQDAEAIKNAKKAVEAAYQKEGFNVPEFMEKLNIKLERGVFKRIQE